MEAVSSTTEKELRLDRLREDTAATGYRFERSTCGGFIFTRPGGRYAVFKATIRDAERHVKTLAKLQRKAS